MTGGKHRLDVNFINPFLEGAIELLDKQGKIHAAAGSPALLQARKMAPGDVTGLIEVISESFTGAVIITFPEQTYQRILSTLLGGTVAEVNSDFREGAAELMKLIFDHAMKALNERGYKIQMAAPLILIGHDHDTHSRIQEPRMAVPFETEAGPFTIAITLSS